MKSINHPTRKDTRRRRLIARLDVEIAAYKALPAGQKAHGPRFQFTAGEWLARLQARRAEAAGAVAS